MQAKWTQTHSILLTFVLSWSSVVGAAQSKPAQLSNPQKALHVLDRLAFGPRPGEVEQLAAQGQSGINQWIDAQLHPERIVDQATEEKLQKFSVLKMSNLELFKKFRKLKDFVKEMNISDREMQEKDTKEGRKELREKIGEDNLPQEITREMQSQKILRAVESRRQLQEVLMDFWFNHFNVYEKKGETKWFLPSYERDALRPHLFGKFVDLLKATAYHPAMLFYLDNRVSQVANAEMGKGLNENYAREIMELHTLGVDGGYTQKDVTELARILTGWSIGARKSNPEFKFKARLHDRGAKVFLGQNFLPNQGEEEGVRAIEMLAAHPATAHHISQQLAEYFVSEHPPKSLVDKLTRTYMSTGGDLRKVYQALFTSDEFWSPQYFQSKIKKPFFYTASAIRALGGSLEIESDVHKALNAMGEDLYHCVPPTGYKDTADAWVNPGAMVSRMNFALRLANDRIDGVNVTIPHSSQALDAKTLVSQLQSRLLHRELSANTQSVIFKELEGEDRVMEDGETRPVDLTKATALLIASPEFQRR